MLDRKFVKILDRYTETASLEELKMAKHRLELFLDSDESKGMRRDVNYCLEIVNREILRLLSTNQ